MSLHPGISVFDRSGKIRLGTIPAVYTVTVPRSYRLNEITDFTFYIPQADTLGNIVLDPITDALLARDNLIYIEDEMYGLAGWGGAITDVNYKDERATVSCLGGMSLLNGLSTTTITQSGGLAGSVAQQFVLAAAAKQSAHGDAVMGFAMDSSPNLYGSYTYEGDIFTGLQQLALSCFAEMWMESILGPGGATLDFVLHWSDRIVVDHTDVIIRDGAGGQLASGSEVDYSVVGTINRVILRGTPTHLADFLDYPCISSVVVDVAPEADLIVEGPSNHRRREDLNVNVNFGLSDTAQKILANTLQDTYLGYYKTYLYAYHNRQGKPYLDGFDWSGPDGTNDKQITLSAFRTYQKLGRLGAGTVITSETDGDLPEAVIDNWSLDQEINPLGDPVVGVALNYGDLASHWLADGATGEVFTLGSDNVTVDDWGPGVAAGETLLSIATDPAASSSIFTLTTDGTNYFVRSYDVDTHDLITVTTIPATGNPNDLALDVANGKMYVVGDTSANVLVYDLASGTLQTPDTSFNSNLTAPVGLSISGGLGYVIDGGGHVKMDFLSSGTVAGSLDTGIAANGLYVDLVNRRIWLIKADGTLAIYNAYVAIGNVDDPGAAGGAPGFDSLAGGQFVHILLLNDVAGSPGKKSTTVSTTHTVVHGDTLWSLAVRYFGNGSQWRVIYNANRGVIGTNPALIVPGEVLTIPGSTATTGSSGGRTFPPIPDTDPLLDKWFVTFTKGKWFQYPQSGPIGTPDQLIREWQLDDAGQITGTSRSTATTVIDPAIVIQGEEGRVCDWNPTVDGYGEFKVNQVWKTKTGHVIDTGPGWYHRDWDVPANVFQPPVRPDWPEGIAYAQHYLNQANKELTSQQIVVTNADGLWGEIEFGGTYTLQLSKQGPQPGGINIVIRALAFSPSEFTGELTMIAEVLTAVPVDVAPPIIVIPPPPPPPPPLSPPGGGTVITPPPPVFVPPPGPVTVLPSTIPPSIDATGATDVSVELAAYLNSLPDGSTVYFSPTGNYRVDKAIKLGGRRNLTLEGQGCTIFAFGSGYTEDYSIFYFQSFPGTNSGVVIHAFDLVGSSPTPGTFISGHEGQHGVLTDGGNNFTIYGCTGSAFFGDFLEVNGGATNVEAYGNTITNTGRNSLSVIWGSHVNFHDNACPHSGYMPFDVEPNTSSEPCTFITINNNTFGFRTNAFFAVDGSQTGAACNNISCTNNSGTTVLLTIVNNGSGGSVRNGSITVSGNSTTATASGPVMQFHYCDGLVVQHNTQPLSSGSLVSTVDCPAADITPNP